MGYFIYTVLKLSRLCTEVLNDVGPAYRLSISETQSKEKGMGRNGGKPNWVPKKFEIHHDHVQEPSRKTFQGEEEPKSRWTQPK